MVIEELVALLKFKADGTGQMAAFTRGLQGISKELAGIGRLAATAGAALGTAMTAGVAALGKGSIETGMAFEKMAATLEVIEGSAEKAKASLDWVSEFAATTPYEINEVAEAFVKLKGYGIDPLKGSLTAAGNAAAAMGKPVMQAVEAIADAVTGENERLKEFGIKAKQAGDTVEYSWQQNGKELKKKVKKDAASIEKALIEIMEGRFAGAMEKQSKTLAGIISNIKDTFTRFQTYIANAGWYQYVKDRFQDVLTYIQKLDKEGTLKRWGEDISRVLIQASTSILRIGRALRDLAKYAISAAPSVEALGMAFGALLAVVRPAWFAIAGILLALDDIQAFREGDVSVFGWLVNQIKEFFGVQDGLAETIAGWGSAIGALILLNLRTLLPMAFRAGGALLMSALPLLLTPPGMAVAAGAAALALIYIYRDELMALAGQLMEAGKVMGTMVKDGFLAIVDAFVEVGATIGQSLFEGLKSVGGEIMKWFKGLFSGISLPSFGGKTEGLKPLGDPMGGVQRLGSLNQDSIKRLSSAGAGNGTVNQTVGDINVTVTQSNASASDIAGAVKKAAVDSLRSLSVSGARPAVA